MALTLCSDSLQTSGRSRPNDSGRHAQVQAVQRTIFLGLYNDDDKIARQWSYVSVMGHAYILNRLIMFNL